MTDTTWPEAGADLALGDGRSAHASFQPETAQALCETVREQVALGQAIYPQGGKTALDYGGTPGRPGVVICTNSISRLIDYPYADMTITVEAGMTLATLARILADSSSACWSKPLLPTGRRWAESMRPTPAAPGGLLRAGRATRSSASASPPRKA